MKSCTASCIWQLIFHAILVRWGKKLANLEVTLFRNLSNIPKLLLRSLLLESDFFIPKLATKPNFLSTAKMQKERERKRGIAYYAHKVPLVPFSP